MNINNRGLSREADLSSTTSATLTFSYRRQRLDGNGGQVRVQVSDNGGASWTNLQTYILNGTDPAQVPQSFDAKLPFLGRFLAD